MTGDEFPDVRRAAANWTALRLWGDDDAYLDGLSLLTFNGVRISRRSFALLFAAPSLLMTMKDASQ